MSTEKIYQAVLQAGRRCHRDSPFHDHLDIGAGSGRLIRLFHDEFATASRACDYTDKLMELPGQGVDIVDLNVEPRLAYPDGRFDLVTATELLEHLEDFRRILREIYRVLRPRGVCILSTPNVLNINSRLRYLWFGFPDLFGPLPVGGRDIHLTAGHITPVPYFYLVHALREAGFTSTDCTFDKYQRSGILKLIPLFLLIRLFGGRAFRREIHKYHTVNSGNAPYVREINSIPMLLGRTIILCAKKSGH